MTDTQDGSYDAFLDALEAGDGYYYECADGHALVPPRRVCPHCGDRELERVELPETGSIVTHTTVAVPTPQFEDDAPYVTAIATFGQVKLTGILRDVDPNDVEIGQEVTVTIDTAETTDDRTITFDRHS
ncbi:Zn-ribbon domain-containing OB-fold protein [Natronorubrum sulfidifaciens]|uniref:DUF35 domain-containing protein n=1 Tax=Natronorubrum sulfidifaciens JCM 14089 TaxID=1230460 RepID=L9WJ78_9EURY|nr:OB-fold domain-containing protein [Natronorubrum sulfidifaciens]ELY49442.1 hypothetical protein C495_00715 [Natronorubrum sulfidifaciens JCM 14089]